MTTSRHSGLRVLLVVPPSVGGMRRHVSLLATHLPRRGCRVAVAAPEGFELIGDVSCERHVVDIGTSLDLKRHRAAIAGISQLVPGYDLVHAHGVKAAFIAVPAARSRAVACVVTAHNNAPKRIGVPTRLMFAWAIAGAAVIAVSRSVCESLPRLGVDANRVTIVPNGVDLSYLDAADGSSPVPGLAPMPSDARVIAGIGRLSPEKGFMTLVEAMPRIVEKLPEAALLLAGDGPERAKIEERVAALGLKPSIVFLGFVDDVRPLLRRCSLVAIPSVSEGQGIAALEAMAARKPVVASRVGGLVETVRDGETGLLVPPGDPGALADAIVRLLGDSEARERMGAAGRALVESEYTIDRMIDATMDVYRQTVRT